MKGRESRFPERSGSQSASWSVVRRRDANRRHPLVWLLGLILTGFWFFWDGVEPLMDAAFAPSAPAVPQLSATKTPAIVPAFALPEKSMHLEPEKAASISTSGRKPVATLAIPVPISIAFRPVGFEIPAQSHVLPLAHEPGSLIRHEPVYAGHRQLYATLQLNRGQQISLVLDLIDTGAQLYVDKNRNGDLRDDGQPIENQGSGRFSAKLNFALPIISGIARLQGDYVLWLYLTNGSKGALELKYYAMTQLKGRLRLDGDLFTIWLADNRQTDGDYQNDGVYIDLNRDGKIQSPAEYLAPGQMLQWSGRRYRFLIEP